MARPANQPSSKGQGAVQWSSEERSPYYRGLNNGKNKKAAKATNDVVQASGLRAQSLGLRNMSREGYKETEEDFVKIAW